MSVGCARWLLSHTVRTVCSGRPTYWAPASRLTTRRERYNLIAASCRWFTTDTNVNEQLSTTKKKRLDPRGHSSINSVGRKIPQRQIQVIGENDEDLGVMHRADVIRVMDEKTLKLVLVNEEKEPPIYKLMSGKQIHEEQLKLREKNKTKAVPVQVKELTFSASIAAHDLTTKLKQVESWLEKKHHVRITLRAGHAQLSTDLGTTLEQMVEQMDVMVGFVSKPKVIRDGQAAMCILRQPSAKELSQKTKKEATNPTHHT